MTTEARWDGPGQARLDELLMRAAEGHEPSVAALGTALRGRAPCRLVDWPPALREAWESGAELVLEAFDRRNLREADVTLVLALAAAGFDRPLLRDLLAASARARFAAYADPAGLIQALGVRDPATTVVTIAERWGVMAELQVGVACVHATHGVGEIQQVDGVANQVVVRFTRAMRMPLDMALSALTLVRRGSLIDSLRRAPERLEEVAAEPERFRRDAAASLLPQPGLWAEMTAALLSGTGIDGTRLAGILNGVSTEAEAPAAQESVATAPARQWFEARSVAELVEITRRLDAPVVAAPEQAAHLGELWLQAAGREEQAEVLCEAVAQLWRLAPNAPWLAEMICGLGDRAVGWQRQDLFVRLTDHLAGKLVPPWFAATATAVGMDRFVELGVELPLRLWTALERQVIETDGAPERLVGEVLTRVEEAQTSADMLLWLWKSERPERDGMAVPVLVFRTLARPVRGSFIKAAKELRKLLNDSPDFQRFMMHGGDPDAVTELVRCIRQLPLLDTGEQQSLLVKIVRLYPEAKPLVEQRRTVVTRRPVDKVTSVRSFELRRRELHQIVSVKVPANSRAIAHARGYGDLRENAEYKAAKDEQRYLNARRRELERGLNEVRSMDFALISVADRIVPGCSVVMAYPDGRREEFHVLGLWDSIPDRRMISYDTPLGRLLLGRQVGETVAVPSGQEAKVAGIRGLSQDLLVWLRGDDLEPEKA